MNLFLGMKVQLDEGLLAVTVTVTVTRIRTRTRTVILALTLTLTLTVTVTLTRCSWVRRGPLAGSTLPSARPSSSASSLTTGSGSRGFRRRARAPSSTSGTSGSSLTQRRRWCRTDSDTTLWRFPCVGLGSTLAWSEWAVPVGWPWRLARRLGPRVASLLEEVEEVDNYCTGFGLSPTLSCALISPDTTLFSRECVPLHAILYL